MTGLGFLVAVPDDTVVPLDSTFEFFVTRRLRTTPTTPRSSLRPQPIVDVTDPADTDVVHRYKANVPVLSNLTGASQGPAPTSACSCRGPTSTAPTPGTASRRWSPRAPTCASSPATRPPPRSTCSGRRPTPGVRAPGGRPPITPPAGSTGAPAQGIELDADTPPAVAAVIRSSPGARRQRVQLRQRQRHGAHTHPGVRGPSAEPMDHLAVPRPGRRVDHLDRGQTRCPHPLRQRRHQAEAVDRRDRRRARQRRPTEDHPSRLGHLRLVRPQEGSAMATTYKTPGVYIEEIPKFPPSVAPVDTAIPAFIGYTEKAIDEVADDLILKPKRIESLVEFEQYFGGPQLETGITVTIERRRWPSRHAGRVQDERDARRRRTARSTSSTTRCSCSTPTAARGRTSSRSGSTRRTGHRLDGSDFHTRSLDLTQGRRAHADRGSRGAGPRPHRRLRCSQDILDAVREDLKDRFVIMDVTATTSRCRTRMPTC